MSSRTTRRCQPVRLNDVLGASGRRRWSHSARRAGPSAQPVATSTTRSLVGRSAGW
jgi:hypothetical protein